MTSSEKGKVVVFSDDASDAGSTNMNMSLPRPVTGVSITKPTTAPQIFRTPVFAEPSTQQPEVAVPPPISPSTRSPRPPSRPTTSSAATTTKPGSSHQKKHNVNLDNRMLMKLATILPSDTRRPDTAHNGGAMLGGTGGGGGGGQSAAGNTTSMANGNAAASAGLGAIGRLPESRTNLIKLHAELDEMVTDIHTLTLESDRYNIALASDLLHNQDPDISNAMEGGNILYDTIIAELTMQGIRKVNRIKKFYRNHIARMKTNHEEDLSELRLKLEEMTARYHELQVKHSTDIMRARSNDSEASHHTKLNLNSTNNHINNNNNNNNLKEDSVESRGLFVHFDEANSIPLPTASHREQLNQYISDRLDHERKLSIAKINILSTELVKVQDELRYAHEEIHSLKKQLLEKDHVNIDKDKIALKDLNSYLKNLLDQYK